jgi:hypothetical protein
MTTPVHTSTAVLLGGLLGLLTACTPQPLVGPPVDLKTIAQPDPVVPPPPEPPPVVVAPSAVPTPPPGWRAWIPPTQAANGDTEEGHFVTISPQAPPVEEVEPAIPMPRAPRNYTPQRSLRGPSREKQAPSRQTPQTPQGPLLAPGTSLTPAPGPQPMPAAAPIQAPLPPALPPSAYSTVGSPVQGIMGTTPATSVTFGGGR